MKILSKILTISALAISMFSAGCSSQSGSRTSIKIGITLYDQYDVFISELMTVFNEDILAEKTNELDISVDTYNAARSQSQQNDQVKNMIANGADVLLVNLVDRTSPTEIINMAKNANTPVIFFNRELVEEDLNRWDRLYYVGANAPQSGEMEGTLAADDYDSGLLDTNQDGSVQYVMLEGETGHQDSIVRTEYSVSTMINRGVTLDKLGYAIANWDRSQGQSHMTQLINQFGTSIELVLSNNDDMALGAIDAYKASDIPQSDWPRIYGVDGTETGLEAVQDGTLAGTVYNDKEKQAQALASLSVKLAKNESIDDVGLKQGKYYRASYQKITAANVDDFLN